MFGLYTGSLFGMSIPQLMGYENMADCPVPFLDFQGKFFSIALVIGIVQIAFGLAVNVYGQSRTFGFTKSFGTLGWLIVLVACALAIGLPMFDMAIPGFTSSSIAFYITLGVGFALMLLLNNLRRNPLLNIGSGLWR